MFDLLLHRHLWVRKAAGRLLGGLFAALPQPTKRPPGWASETILNPPEGLELVAGSLCQQLEADVVDEKLAEQAVKNLVYVAAAMHEVLEEGVKPLRNGVTGLEKGLLGLENGASGLENGITGLKSGVIRVENGVRGLENGVNGRPGQEPLEQRNGSAEVGHLEFEGADEVDKLEGASEGGRWQRDRCPTLKSLFRRVARIVLRVEVIQVSWGSGF